MNRNNILTIVFITALFMLSMLWTSCDLVDASKVTNPQITQENLDENASGGTTALVTGIRRRFATAMANQTLVGDLVSDNMTNMASFYDNQLDRPWTITPKTFTYDACYENFLRTNALCDFGFNTIIPNDALVTANQIAEIHFYKGLSLLLLAENYHDFPIVDKGPTVTAAQATQIAITEFTAGLTSTVPAMPINCRLGLARAYRLAGDKVNALAQANAALALTGGTTYVFYAQFDITNGPTSVAYAALTSRASNDIQPLPRLDFLDPKYNANTVNAPVLKAEEAYLIRAEVALSNGDFVTARAEMTNAVTLARSRATVSYIDRDTRSGRPNYDTLTVRSDATYPAVAGLIKRRSGSTVTVYQISGTSQTAATITALAALTPAATLRFEHIRTLYLLRQEIFFAEGRRMSDLGIRLPVTQRQLDGNPNAGTGSNVVVPSFIPINNEMDVFSTAAPVVTILWDMNKLIATNIATVGPIPIP
jgi:hypothetical protein